MKRQLLLSVALSVLATSAFALPAAEQAIPQAKLTPRTSARPLPKVAAIAWNRKVWLKVARTACNSANSLPRAAPTVWMTCIKLRAKPVPALKKARSPVIGL